MKIPLPRQGDLFDRLRELTAEERGKLQLVFDGDQICLEPLNSGERGLQLKDKSDHDILLAYLELKNQLT